MPKINELIARETASSSLFPFAKDIGGGAYQTGRSTLAEIIDDNRALFLDGVNACQVADTTALAALDTAQWKAAITSAGVQYVFNGANLSAQITALDPRYIAPAAAPTGASGAWVMAGSDSTGQWKPNTGARVQRMNDRVFIGGGAGASGNAGGAHGNSPDLQKHMPWLQRDATVYVNSWDGSAAIVGVSETENSDNFQYAPFYPAGIAVIGCVLNNGTGTKQYNPAWGGYFDAQRMNDGFTVGIEVSISNLTTEIEPNVFNLWGGGHSSGVASWLQTGAGKDILSYDYTDWKNVASYETYLSSYRPGDLATNPGGNRLWQNNTALIPTVYAKGHVAKDPADGLNYVCRIGNTPPASGTFAAYKAANPTHWAVQVRKDYEIDTYNAGDMLREPITKVWYHVTTDHTAVSAFFATARTANPTYYRNQPAARAGRIVHVGAIDEASPGSNTFVVDAMPTGHLIIWQRDSGSNDAYGDIAGTAAFVYADHDAQNVGQIFKDAYTQFNGIFGVRASLFQAPAYRVGDATNAAVISRGLLANDNITYTNPGTGHHVFLVNGVTEAQIFNLGINLPTGNSLFVNNNAIVGERKTGWAVPTGTLTRTTFATGTVTLPQLAERVAALISDLYSGAPNTPGILGA